MDGHPTQRRKPLGLVLQEAGLITPAQLEVALNNQKYSDYLIGEVIALHGWAGKGTVDFFAEQWFDLVYRPNPLPLGHYLQMADLLNQHQIGEILTEQKQLGLRFGVTAVFMGLIKQQTVDYFMAYLKAERAIQSPFCTEELTKIGKAMMRPTKVAQRTKENSPEVDVSQNEQARAMPKSIVDLPDNFDIFAINDKNCDLANLGAIDDDSIFS